MSTFLEQLFNGLIIASVLLLIALGLTFTFGQMGVINMAQGELIMAGAFTPYVLQSQVAWFAGAAGTAFLVRCRSRSWSAAARVPHEPDPAGMYGRALDTLLVTFGIALLLQQVAKDIFGAPNVEVVVPSWFAGTGRSSVSRCRTRGCSSSSSRPQWCSWSGLFMSRLAQGRRMRAVMQNRELAAVERYPDRARRHDHVLDRLRARGHRRGRRSRSSAPSGSAPAPPTSSTRSSW